MATRRVFGRQKFLIDGINYRFEFRREGPVVRELYHRQEWLVKPEHLLRLCQPQTEMFHKEEMCRNEKVAESNKVQPVPDLQEKPLVPDRP